MFRRMRFTWIAPFAVLALSLASRAQAQELPPEEESPEQGVPEPESPEPESEMPGLEEPHPLVVLHAINQIQSQLGLMGVNEAASEDVSEFADELADTHSAFDRAMLETANELDIDVAGSGQVRMAMEQRLQNLDPQLHMLMQASPQVFDEAFLDVVVRSHEDAIEAVRELRSEVEEESVRALMDEAIEGYSSHLEEARELQSEHVEDAE